MGFGFCVDVLPISYSITYGNNECVLMSVYALLTKMCRGVGLLRGIILITTTGLAEREQEASLTLTGAHRSQTQSHVVSLSALTWTSFSQQ